MLLFVLAGLAPASSLLKRLSFLIPSVLAPASSLLAISLPSGGGLCFGIWVLFGSCDLVLGILFLIKYFKICAGN